jgi:hypothetical protein
MTSSGNRQQWVLRESDDGLSLEPIRTRALGSESFTWAHLLYGKLALVKVLVVYFPSRTDSLEDESCKEILRAFGENTGEATSVNFWDPTDPEFSHALALFGLKAPPAIVLASGLKLEGVTATGPIDTPLYTLTITDRNALRDRDEVSESINAAHEVLMRCNPSEIAGYIQRRELGSLLEKIGSIGARVRDQLLKLKPSFGLPGGFSISLG